MRNFDELLLPEKLRANLEAMNFKEPTPVQAQAIPPALEGRDILGSAQTGTGKTGAFGIPLITKLMVNSRGGALVITPTRELAMQVLQQLELMLGNNSTIKTALLIGGEPMPKQLNQLRRRPRLLVGTPGRINDHLERGSLMLHDTNFLVLDETDRMLDMGFSIQIEKIMKFLPQQRQTLLFSATLPKNIMQITKQYLTDPVRVAVNLVSSAAENITQEVLHLSDGEKYARFKEELTAREGSVIVFVKTKHATEKMADKLRKEGYKADAIHGDLRQNVRDKVILNFRNKKYRVLVATDIAARGLDIPHIEHVINYDLPQCPEDYIHRIGRTARAGAKGETLSFVTPGDKLKWGAIQKLLNPNHKEEKPQRSASGKPGSAKPGAGKAFGKKKRPFKGKGKPGGAPDGRPQGGNNGDRRKSDGASAASGSFKKRGSAPSRPAGERRAEGDKRKTFKPARRRSPAGEKPLFKQRKAS